MAQNEAFDYVCEGDVSVVRQRCQRKFVSEVDMIANVSVEALLFRSPRYRGNVNGIVFLVGFPVKWKRASSLQVH